MTTPTPARAYPPIATLTMNPALDITTTADNAVSPQKLRCDPVRYDPGGGGINTARVAHVLEAAVTAIFPAGGPIGDMLTAKLVTETGITVRQIHIAQETRENFIVNERHTGCQFRFVMPGPRLSVAEQRDCLTQLQAAAANVRYVVASGSLPPGVAPEFYQRVADLCTRAGVRLILDTSDTGIEHIASGVYLLKTSAKELGARIGRLLATQAERVDAARDLIGAGCTEIVLITLGAEGALLVTAETARYQPPVTVRTNGGVGAGDGMIAAMTVALNRDKPIEQAVKLGAAAGAAVLVNPGTAGCRRSEIVDLLTRAPDAVDAVERADVYSFIQNQITAARHRQHGRGRRVQAAPRSDQTA